MDQPPGVGGTATNVSMANQTWRRMLRQARLEEAKLRKAGGAGKERKGPMATFGGALGAGAKPQRRTGIVTDQREFLLTVDEEDRDGKSEERLDKRGRGEKKERDRALMGSVHYYTVRGGQACHS